MGVIMASGDDDSIGGSDCVPVRIGVVSFFNARPLTYGLAENPLVELSTHVPAELGEALGECKVDAALIPSVDYQESDGEWLVLGGGAIASCGEVLTVRVFSREPLEQVGQLACDGDSHTSVVLARIVWRLRFGRELDVVELNGVADSQGGVLLIGDKVLKELGKWPYELDLGAAWTELTGLPFVYAFWAVRGDCDTRGIEGVLEQARREGVANVDDIVGRYAERHGFSCELGRRYLTENIRFELGEQERKGLVRFYELAHEFGLVPRCRPLRMYAQ